MDSLVSSMIDFMRARQLNIAVAGLLTLVYLVYQYWTVLFKVPIAEDLECHHTTRLSRSRSRSASRSRTRAGHYDYKIDDKHGRRRKTRRCPDCSLCNFEQQ